MQTVPLELLINGLTVATGAALIVERFTEVLKQIRERANRYFLEQDAEKSRQQALTAAQQQLAAINQQRQAGASALSAVQSAAAAVPAGADCTAVRAAADSADNVSDHYEQYRAVLHVPLTPVSQRTAAFNLFLLIAPMALGIILAGSFDLHFIALFTGQEVETIAQLAQQHAWGRIAMQTADTFLTGLLIGGGSQPVHVLLRFLTTRKLTAEEQKALAQISDPGTESQPQAAVATSVSSREDSSAEPFAWQPLRYEGGVNPQSLERVHLRPADPSQIVVHHTAMHSSLSFTAIVDEFLQQKKWLTGYHCVIMPDGSIRPFCRWDRSGSHAKGHNAATLGISFHGNFHQQAGDPYSNHDGRYGNTRPTDAQLQAGARVIALWRSLYGNIPQDIAQAVVPHRALSGASTVCPGNQFPLDTLFRRVMAFEQAWKQSASAAEQLALFRQKPFLYVTSAV